MPKRDMLAECYVGEHQKNLSPENFQRVFCQRCRNAGCANSAVGSSRWVNRMETQKDLLLDNPLFADPNDPRFESLRNLNFEDVIRQVMALEVSSQKGDWEIPSEADVSRMASAMAGGGPVGYEAPEDEPEPEPDPNAEPEVLWEGTARGAKKAVYDVALTDLGDGNPVWTCTCPNFHYRKAPPEGCKHIVEARDLYIQSQRAELDQAEQVTEEKIEQPEQDEQVAERQPADVDPESWGQMRERGHVPRAQNTRYPNDGLMIDGSPPPETPPAPTGSEDPWAIPQKPDGDVVEVHGQVRMGGRKK